MYKVKADDNLHPMAEPYEEVKASRDIQNKRDAKRQVCTMAEEVLHLRQTEEEAMDKQSSQLRDILDSN